MKPGVGFPSYGASLVWSEEGGSPFDPNYPVTNLSDTVYLTKVARATTAGYRSLLGVFPTDTTIQALAICNHNMGPSDLWRIRGFSTPTPDAGTDTPVFDTGVLASLPSPAVAILKPDGTPRYRQTRPFVLSSPVATRSLFLEFGGGTAPVSVGAIEAAGWWAWEGISQSRDTGIDSRETSVPLVGGGEIIPSEFCARQINGQIDYIALGASGTDRALDFQAGTDIQQPFLFVNDTTDVTSWPRLALMVTNVQIPPLVGAVYRQDRFAFQFNEALR